MIGKKEVGKVAKICNTGISGSFSLVKGGPIMTQNTLLGLPAETWLIVGGLYFIATFLPSAIVLFLKRREVKKSK